MRKREKREQLIHIQAHQHLLISNDYSKSLAPHTSAATLIRAQLSFSGVLLLN